MFGTSVVVIAVEAMTKLLPDSGGYSRLDKNDPK